MNLESNPNNNYDVLHDLICALKQKHFPNKKKKNYIYKHKSTPWITTGILKPIKFKNKIHLAHHMNLLITIQLKQIYEIIISY